MGRNLLHWGSWEEKPVSTCGGALFQKATSLVQSLPGLVSFTFLIIIGRSVILKDEWEKMRDFELSEWRPGSSTKITLVNVLNNLLIAELDVSMSGLIWLDLIYMMSSA